MQAHGEREGKKGKKGPIGTSLEIFQTTRMPRTLPTLLALLSPAQPCR